MYTPYSRFGGDELKIVNGRSSAEQYFMYPNSRTILLDSSCDRFYLKETDASGFSKITTYDFKEVKEEPEQDKYLTKAEFEELMKKYELNFKQSTMEQSTTKPTVQTKF